MFVNINVMKILIREAQKKDMNSVHKLIVELAVYEKEPDAVEIDIEELTNMGFSSTPPLFKCLIAEVNNTIVGAAIIYNRFSTWKGKTLHLEDLIITETMRNNGIGSKLFDEVIRYGKKIGAQRISWNVIDWNQSAIKFYESKGAEIVKGWSIVHLSGNNLKNYS
jgi:GNAT superfamily N-acetyltransferase